jgi:hypothetical protein
MLTGLDALPQGPPDKKKEKAEGHAEPTAVHNANSGRCSFKALLRLDSGSIQARFRLYCGSIKALLRLY